MFFPFKVEGAMKKERKEEERKNKSDGELGFHDGLDGNPCKPISLEYLRGYEFGLETARIGTAPKH